MEVFEKIIQKLDNYKKKHRGASGYYISVANDIKDIVKEVAEEYNNSMISVSRWKYTRDEKPNATRQVIVVKGGSISHYGYYLKKKDKWYTDHRCDVEIVEPIMWMDMPEVPKESIMGDSCC